MGLFAQALNDLGDYAEKNFDGDLCKLVESAKNSCEKLASILSGMPFFRDVQQYKGFEVPFFKRAQLTAADLAAVRGHRMRYFLPNRRPEIYCLENQ